jgi:hypothetical protein
MSQYDSKVQQVEKSLENMKLESITVHKVPSISASIMEKMKSQFNILYSPVKLKTGIIRKTEPTEGERTLSCESKKNFDKSNSVYISFENKQIFENAMSAMSISELSTGRLAEKMKLEGSNSSNDTLVNHPATVKKAINIPPYLK